MEQGQGQGQGQGSVEYGLFITNMLRGSGSLAPKSAFIEPSQLQQMMVTTLSSE
jgi:hypothetical protein